MRVAGFNLSIEWKPFKTAQICCATIWCKTILSKPLQFSILQTPPFYWCCQSTCFSISKGLFKFMQNLCMQLLKKMAQTCFNEDVGFVKMQVNSVDPQFSYNVLNYSSQKWLQRSQNHVLSLEISIAQNRILNLAIFIYW